MKLWDVLLQCGVCNETIDARVVQDMWQVGDETLFFCHKCGTDDDDAAIVTYIDLDRVLDDPEEIKAALEAYATNTEEVDHLIRDQLPKELESVTVWTVPLSKYPKRDWLTLKEAAEEAGVPKPTLQTWLYREKLFLDQISGWIQKTESTTLIHRSVIKKIEELKTEKAKEKD